MKNAHIIKECLTCLDINYHQEWFNHTKKQVIESINLILIQQQLIQGFILDQTFKSKLCNLAGSNQICQQNNGENIKLKSCKNKLYLSLKNLQRKSQMKTMKKNLRRNDKKIFSGILIVTMFLKGMVTQNVSNYFVKDLPILSLRLFQ